MGLLLFWSRRSVASNAGHAEILTTLALGEGHVVVEEIDGHAEIQVTLAEGTGHVVRPQPRPNFAVRPPSHFLLHIKGRGRATVPAPTARGSGAILYERVYGDGVALLPYGGASGAGRLTFPLFQGSGEASIDALSASGLGVLFMPPPPAVEPAQKTLALTAPWEADYQPQARATRRRKAAAAAFDDDDELLLLMESK